MDPKPLVFVGRARKELLELGEVICLLAGHKLWEVQLGEIPIGSKPLHGFGGASVQELVIDENRDTFRVVYVVKFEEAIYLLHSFQKKSAEGSKTPARHIEIIKERLKMAEERHREWLKQNPEKPGPKPGKKR